MPRYIEEYVQPLPPPVQLGKISEDDLKAYDGNDPHKPLLMAIKGQIYDVLQSRYTFFLSLDWMLFLGENGEINKLSAIATDFIETLDVGETTTAKSKGRSFI
ncbi:putative cytochrome b5-like heme/steroid binding domain superfamily [Helianthus debilis subsp. tardiflorus]